MHTFTLIYLHVVFATWSRRPDLTPPLRPRVHAYLAGSARQLGLSDVEVGGHDDHVHLLARFDPAVAPSSVIGQLKQATTHRLQQEGVPAFRWQRGFGAFSVSRDRVAAVRRYVQRQEEHHVRRTFADEFEALLSECGASMYDAQLL